MNAPWHKTDFSHSWTDERVERLKTLWKDGWSGSEIAAELRGISRNAVISKIHRLGLAERSKGCAPPKHRVSRRLPRETRQKPKREPRVRLSIMSNFNSETIPPTPHRVKVERPDCDAPEALKLQLTELTDKTCKWPYGDPQHPDFHFCGHRSEPTGPYCTYHAKKAGRIYAD